MLRLRVRRRLDVRRSAAEPLWGQRASAPERDESRALGYSAVKYLEER